MADGHLLALVHSCTKVGKLRVGRGDHKCVTLPPIPCPDNSDSVSGTSSGIDDTSEVAKMGYSTTDGVFEPGG